MAVSRHHFRSNTLPAIVMVGPVILWLLFFVTLPLLYVLIMSFCGIDDSYNVVFQFTAINYQRIFDPNYIQIYATSLIVAFLTTLICIAIGYPFSFLIARTGSKHKAALYMMVIIPFWTNSLIRIYGWRTLLGTNGWLNTLLSALHITSRCAFFLTGARRCLAWSTACFPSWCFHSIRQLKNWIRVLWKPRRIWVQEEFLPLFASSFR